MNNNGKKRVGRPRKERLPLEIIDRDGIEIKKPKPNIPDPLPTERPEEENPEDHTEEDEEEEDIQLIKKRLEAQKLENIKLTEIIEDLQLHLVEQKEGTIKNINIKYFLGQLNFHHDAGEVYVDIKYNGKDFRRLDPSDYNPVSDLVNGLVPKIDRK